MGGGREVEGCNRCHCYTKEGNGMEMKGKNEKKKKIDVESLTYRMAARKKMLVLTEVRPLA